MYCLPVDSMNNSYYGKSFIEIPSVQKITASDYFEKYKDVINERKLPLFNDVKNKSQSYLEYDENASSEYTLSEIKRLIQRFENKFDMSSDKFKELYAIGDAPDAFEIILWKSFLGLK